MSRLLFVLFWLLAVPATAQVVPLQAGPYTAGHLPVYVGTGIDGPVIQDAGPAGGAATSPGATELELVAPQYPTGPDGTNFCDYDAAITSPTGYHYLCFSANAQGGGLLAYGAAGAASALPFQFVVNGVIYNLSQGLLPTFSANSVLTTNSIQTLWATTLPSGLTIPAANLGVPAAIDLANATLCAVSSCVSGLGSGVATALGNGVNTANGVITGARFRTVNAVLFGADPTGTVDSTAAINAAIASITPGSGFPYEPGACVYLPTGNYIVSDAITLATLNGCLFGDGRTATILNVSSSTMNLAANGVIVLPNTSGATSSWVHDIGIQMVQPDVSSRGSIVAFPSGIYMQGAARALIENVRISGGSYCIDARGNAGGSNFNNVECGALVKGLQMDGSLDAVHIDGWHAWPFYGLETTGLENIYNDGTTELGTFGRVDSLTATNVTSQSANIVYTSNANSSVDVSHWSNVTLDSAQWQQSGGYNTVDGYSTTDGGTTPSGSSTPWGPAIQVSSGALSFSNFAMTRHNPTSAGAINVTGGALNINSTLQGSSKFGIECVGPGSEPCITETGGFLALTNSYMDPINGGAWTQPYVYQTGGIIQISGTWWNAGFANGYTAVDVTSDTAGSFVLNNNYNGWVQSVPVSGTETQYGVNLTLPGNISSANPGGSAAIQEFSASGSAAGLNLGLYPSSIYWQVVKSAPNNFVIFDYLNSTDAFVIFPGGSTTIGEAATNVLTVNGAVQSSSSPPTLTGTCSTHSAVGSILAGSLTINGVACTIGQTIIMTVPSSTTHGYACDATDGPSSTSLIHETGYTPTTVTFSVLAASTGTTDTIIWKCIGF